MTEHFRVKAFVNIRYMSVAKVVTVALSTVVNIVLAQNLASADFGIYGFALIFITFLLLFKDLGMGTAVIQKENLDDRGLYSAFTINLVLGCAICLYGFILSPVAGIFFHDKAVVLVIRVLSLNFLINAFSFLPNSLLTRELSYRKLFFAQVYSSIFGAATSIVLALSGFKYWSIVIASLCTSLTTTIVLNFLRPVRIRILFDREKASELVHFGGSLFLTGLLAFITFNMDNFTIGTVQGSKGLGYYTIAFNWGATICGLLATTVHTVLFPTFSKIQGDWDRLKRIYLRVLGYISFISILANIILFVVAKDFLFFILGRGTDKWLPALTAFRILCIYGIIRSLLEPVGSVILALGKANMILKANIVSAVLTLVFIYPAVLFFGLVGAAIVATAAYATQYLIYFPFLESVFGLRYREVWSAAKPAIISASLVVMFSSMHAAISRTNSIFMMGQKILLGAAGFFLLHEMISRGKFIKETRTIMSDLKLMKPQSPQEEQEDSRT